MVWCARFGAAAFLAVAPSVCVAEDPFEVVWGVHIGSANAEIGQAVCVDGSGNVLSGGVAFGELFSPSAGSRDAFISKHDADGNFVWGRQFGTSGSDQVTGVAVDGAGNVYASGYTNGMLFPPGAGGVSAFLAKHDVDGNLVWGRQIGPVQQVEPIGVAVDGSAVYIVGAAAFNALLVKYDTDGNLLWTRQFGTTLGELGSAVATDRSGNVYVTGLVTDGVGVDGLLIKYNASGTELWSRQFDSGANDVADAVAVDGSGAVLVAGRTDGNLGAPTSGPTFLRKYGPNGGVIWTRQLDGVAPNVAVDGGGNALLAGAAPEVNPDVLVVKYDGDGTMLWSLEFGGSTFGSDALAIATDASGDAYVCGLTEGDLFEPGAGTDAFVARLSGELACYPDCDGNSVLDVFDFICFQDAFVAGDPFADCDGNNELNVFDFICFQDAFVTGCP